MSIDKFESNLKIAYERSWHSGQVLDWHSIGVSSIHACDNLKEF